MFAARTAECDIPCFLGRNPRASLSETQSQRAFGPAEPDNSSDAVAAQTAGGCCGVLIGEQACSKAVSLVHLEAADLCILFTSAFGGSTIRSTIELP